MVNKGEKVEKIISDENYTELKKRYDDLFQDEKNLFAISDRLKQLEKDPDGDVLRYFYCNEILYIITGGFIEYRDLNRLKKEGQSFFLWD